ncbi:MAG: hypothetical protein ACFFDK_10915 [Promethearchaeota archaeon]
MEEKKLELLIDGLWILESSSRICIFEENYVDFIKEGKSTDMVSSFLAALLTFADETFIDEIQFIKFSNRKILFKFSQYLLFVFAINDKDNNKDFQIKAICNIIINRFNEKFVNIFENNNWNGNISIFESFSEDLREIINREPLKIKIFELFDIKEHFKKIESYIKKKRGYIVKNKEKIEKFLNDLKLRLNLIRNIKPYDENYKVYNRFLI